MSEQEVALAKVENVFGEADRQKLEAKLAQHKQFKAFLNLQKDMQDLQKKMEATWDNIEEQMIAHNIDSVKGDWGYITIAAGLKWNVDTDLLPRKFIKKVINTSKLTDTYRLEGKAPKGAVPSVKKYLTKRIK